MQASSRWARLGVAAITAAIMFAADATAADELRDKVVAAALRTYVHGVDAEIAHSAIGSEGLPVLHQLLADPSFPRRDNVVAFLTYLGNNRSVRVLDDFLRNPPAAADKPEEDRALLLAPHALGEIARRGNSLALRLLLRSTRDRAKGGVLAAAARRARIPESMRDDLLEMAVRALGRSGRKAALPRLQAIAEGLAVPAPGGRPLGGVARTVLRSHERPRSSWESDRHGISMSGAAGARPHRAFGVPVGGAAADSRGGGAGSSEVMLHNAALDYANHVAHPSPMTDARLDAILADANMRIKRQDFGGDVGCCVQLYRKGTGRTFGAVGDGLDIVDNDVEMFAVLGQAVARVKVVRLINWCGSPGTNIIGCAYIGGRGMVVARYGDVWSEGALWVHEYGHNAGLGHNSANTRLIMYPIISHNDGLTSSECPLLHTPSQGAQADLEVVGPCLRDHLEESVCGDGIAAGGEPCDGDDLRGQSCGDFGFDAGVLACSAECALDTSGCSRCGNGVREGAEQCDGADLGGATCGDFLCRSGTPACTAACRLSLATCHGCPACDNDGTCDLGESCTDCPYDCASGSGAECGNGICEVRDGEDCIRCPQDCNGEQGASRRRSFCCGLGGDRPVGCGDLRCRSNGFRCSTAPAEPSCCGDGQCTGFENRSSCEIDCGFASESSACGNGRCEAGENSCSCALDCGQPPAEICNDGIDNDCDGAVDCSDADSCAQAALCLCAPPGAACNSHADCCSYECMGKLRRKTCR